jgi:hypothetical protein
MVHPADRPVGRSLPRNSSFRDGVCPKLLAFIAKHIFLRTEKLKGCIKVSGKVEVHYAGKRMPK